MKTLDRREAKVLSAISLVAGAFAAVVTAGGCCAVETYPDPARSGAAPGVPERRFIWVLEDGMNGDCDWEATADWLKENDFTDVIVRLARGGVAFYESKVVPVSPLVKEKGDILRKAVAACHRRGVKVHAWKVFWRVNMAPEDYVERLKAADRFMYGRYGTPFCGFWQTPNGERVAGAKDDYWMCPADPRNQEEEIAVCRELASLGVDGVQFDYIRYNSWYGCYCPRCRAAYESRCGHAVADWPHDVDPNVRMDPLWLRMRTETITEVVRKATRAVKEANPACEVSAAVFRYPANEPVYVAQDWGAWCREGIVDFVCPMTYTTDLEALRDQLVQQMRVASVSPRTKVYPSVGVDRTGKPQMDAAKTREHADLVRWAGFPGLCYYRLTTPSGKVINESIKIKSK